MFSREGGHGALGPGRTGASRQPDSVRHVFDADEAIVSSRQVLHVINSLGISGGAEQQLVTNLGYFQDASISHRVAYLYGGDPGISWESGVEVPVTALNGNRESTPLIVSAARLHRLVRKTRPDLIHCSLLDASLISRVVGRLTGTPVLESLVNISHEPIRTVDSSSIRLWKLRVYRLLDRMTMGKVTAFHALTDEVARSWVDVIGIDRERITVIPRGVSIERLDSARLADEARHRLRDELTGDADALLLLAIGREEPQKGHRYLIDAFSRLVAGGIDARLVMAGRPGSSSGDLDSLVETSGFASRINRLGVRTDVFELMRAADVMAFPSLYEGLGVSLIEAMGSGLPVVVFDRPPMNQIVENLTTGLVVAERDPAALAAALEKLASDAELARSLGEAAANVVRSEYEVGSTARRLEALYREVLDRQGQPK